MATAHNPKPISEALIRKIGALPSERIAEVEDFVDFIRQRADEAAEDTTLRAWSRAASENALAKAWDNDEDAAYDAL